jgi:menaquinone-dependent protoporphyrinogen oxidase
MTNRILVTYATRAGSTVEVAAAIGETLRGSGFSVDVKPVKEKPSVEGYQAVVVGSAIRLGSWLPEAVNFVKNNQDRVLFQGVGSSTRGVGLD